MRTSTNEATRMATIESSLGTLNDRQREAASCGDAPLLIIAGAGTGKTTTLAHRVAYQIANGVDPGRILLLTFSRRAAGEMLRRVDSLLRVSYSVGPPQGPTRAGNSSVWGGTFHAMATRLLRLHGRSIGLDPGFTILDRTDAEDLLNFVRTELGLSRRERRFPQKATCFDIYSRCVDTGRPLELVLESAFPGAAITPTTCGRSSAATSTARPTSRCSTTTISCCSGAVSCETPRRAERYGRASIACWWTSIKIRTRCRRR